MMDKVLTLTKVESGNEAALLLLSNMHKAAFAPQNELPWNIEAFRDIIASPGVHAHIYSWKETPAGFAVLRTVCDEAEIILISVLPEFQGKGFGAEILANEIQCVRALGAAKIILEVREDNIKATKLYEKLGFKKVATRKKYYKLKQDIRVDASVYTLCT